MRKQQRYDLSGKVALVTGAARGIGYETANALRTRGAQVVITDLDAEQIEAAGERIGSADTLAIAADASDRAAMEGVVEAAVERFGRLDICIPNAGIAPPSGSLRRIDPDAFERVIEVNLLGVWRTIRAAMPHVVEARGQFLLIASIYAFFNGTYATSYASAKAGVEQLGRALKVELADEGVHTAVAYFGFIDTEMVRSTFDREERGVELISRVPFPLNRRLSAATAGGLLADAIEQRKARVIAPWGWLPLFYLRGITGPLMDNFLARDRGMRALARKYKL